MGANLGMNNLTEVVFVHLNYQIDTRRLRREKRGRAHP